MARHIRTAGKMKFLLQTGYSIDNGLCTADLDRCRDAPGVPVIRFFFPKGYKRGQKPDLRRERCHIVFYMWRNPSTGSKKRAGNASSRMSLKCSGSMFFIESEIVRDIHGFYNLLSLATNVVFFLSKQDLFTLP